MKDNEKIYDEQISPLMTKIIEICKEHKIPFFAEFQYSDEGFCRSAIFGQREYGSHYVFQLYDALRQCVEKDGVNIDKFLFALMRRARKTGHSSLILRQLGVEEGNGAPPADGGFAAITITKGHP
jgi:hypothetical protein